MMIAISGLLTWEQTSCFSAYGNVKKCYQFSAHNIIEGFYMLFFVFISATVTEKLSLEASTCAFSSFLICCCNRERRIIRILTNYNCNKKSCFVENFFA